MAKKRVVLSGACGYAARRARVNHVPLFSGRLVSGRLAGAKPSRISASAARVSGRSDSLRKIAPQEPARTAPVVRSLGAGALRSELRQQMHRDLAGFRQRQGVAKL